jgi:dissimilatory sulfite reductase (desulfoviridin) alpha/beta subunit
MTKPSTPETDAENFDQNSNPIRSITETALRDHLALARNMDLNPWFRGHDGEMLSWLTASKPDVGRQVNKEIAIQRDGWMTAEALFHIADMAESKGPGLVEFSGLNRMARLLALDPDADDLPWKGLERSGLAQPESQSKIGLCPFWGPCDGHKRYLSDALLDIAYQLEPEFHDDFQLEILACDRDCQYAAAMADLAVMVDNNKSLFSIWLGGRHRPFRGQISPNGWMTIKISDPNELLTRISSIHDTWDCLARNRETLPELITRIGMRTFENHMALSDTSKSRRKPRGDSYPSEDEAADAR